MGIKILNINMHLMNNLKQLSLTLACFFSFYSLIAQEKPNVIVIYTDDQGTLDLNVYGAKDLLTPNMDALVTSGVRFTQFYASPVCSPSRASLLTGKTPQRAGCPGNAGQNPKSTNGLPGTEYTMAEMFKDAGYETLLIGKWHLGYQPEMLPNAQGFDYSFGHLVGCIDNYSHFYYWNGTNRHNLLRNNEEVYYDGQFFPDLMLKEAGGFFERRSKGKPFFMFYAMNSPHYPYQGEEDWLTYYREKGVAYPRDLYAAFLSTHDERIGALIKMLEQRGLTENTIIVFQSDNGHSTEERAHHGGGFTGPFRGAKQSLFEGGIRVPAAISWPGKIKPNQVRDQFVSVVDWMPTLAELCGLNLDTNDLDGKSIVKLINNENTKTNHEMYAWEFRDTYAIRKGKWKLLGNPYDTSNRAYKYKEKHLLIDLDKDPNESVNLYDDYPQIAEELQQYYLKWKNQ